jgi:hypothetical protein
MAVAMASLLFGFSLFFAATALGEVEALWGLECLLVVLSLRELLCMTYGMLTLIAGVSRSSFP